MLKLIKTYYMLALGLSIFIWTGCSAQIENAVNQSHSDHPLQSNTKQKGAHLFGRIDSTNIQQFQDQNIEWITLVGWAHQEDYNSAEVFYRSEDSLRNVRRDSAWNSQIAVAHAHGYKVFVKPHIWIHSPSEGKWRSDIFPENEEDWETWKTAYKKFILHYARIAEINEAELFSVGTELTRLSIEKPEFWIEIIADIKKIYKGQLTYAANWYEEYENISFWSELDYVGIQAYFPLAKKEKPNIEDLSKAWDKFLPNMKAVHENTNRNILFTEIGYKSTADSAIEPWSWVENEPEEMQIICTQTQSNCYQAFFDRVWNQDWFAGAHIWQLRSDYEGGGPQIDLDFTPQGKPAYEIISKGFK